MAFSKDFARICNLSIFVDILGTSVCQKTFQLPLLTVKILIIRNCIFRTENWAKKTGNA